MADVYPDYLSPEFVAMAHRGGALYSRNLGIENTLTAFTHAVDLGYTYLETDVHATRDAQLVAFHDDSLERMSDLKHKVSQLSLDEIRRIQLGGRELIPTLDELFEAFPTSRFNIDVKHTAAVAPLVDVIKRHRAQRRVCVGSFSRARLSKFRTLLPQVPTTVSPSGVAAMLVGLMPPGGQVFQLPLSYQAGPKRLVLVTPSVIARIHKAGRKIYVWTIDDPTTMHRLIDWGVDGIITDRPDLLKNVLMARGMWSTR